MLAQQALLKEALKDPRNVKFVFLSESCIPLRTGREVYDILVSSESSHMRWYEIWWSDKSRRNLHEFPEGHRHGNHQWIILNRKHAQMIAEDNYWIHLAMKHFGSDESYPSTFFSMCGVLHEFKNELTTYVDWSRGTLSSPYTFSEPTEENLRLLLDAKSNAEGPFAPRSCLFARKISADFPENAIDLIIRSVPAR